MASPVSNLGLSNSRNRAFFGGQGMKQNYGNSLEREES